MVKNDMKSLLANAAATLGRQLGGGLMQLATVALIARTLGPSGNGAFAIGMLIPTALSTLLTLGVPTANVYLVGSARHSVRDAWRGNLRTWGGLAASGTLAGYVVLQTWGAKLFPDLTPEILVIALAAFPPMLLMNLILSLLQAEQRFREFNLTFIALPAIQLALSLIYLLVMSGKSLVALIIFQAFAAGIAAAIGYRFLRRRLLGEPSRNQKYVRPAIRYGAKAHLSNILSYVNHKTDLFLINVFLGASSAGLYVVASQLTERLWLLSQGLSTALLPRLASLEQDEDARRSLTPVLSRWVLALTLLGAGVLALLAGVVVRLIFGGDFSEAAAIIQILAPGIALGSASRILASDFSARGRPELNMYTSWMAMIVNVVGNLALIPVLGLVGSAVSTSFSYALNMAMRCVMYRRITGVPLTDCLVLTTEDINQLHARIKLRGAASGGA